MKPRIANVATLMLAIGAVLVLILIAQRERTNRASPVYATEAGEYVQDWRQVWMDGHRGEGARGKAMVTIIEFSDFGCPFCAAIRPTLRGIQGEHGERVSWVYRHYILGSFEHSEMAAMAAECAAEQSRFRDYHDLLFADQGQIDSTAWLRFAEDAGVPDLNAFERCMVCDGV